MLEGHEVRLYTALHWRLRLSLTAKLKTNRYSEASPLQYEFGNNEDLR